MKRKHHCRLCGRLVCNACSTARIAVNSSNQLERSCCICCGVLQTLESLGDTRVQSNQAVTPSSAALRATSREHDFDRVMRVRRQLKMFQPASTHYYILSADWLQAWFDYSMQHGAHPGSISNHTLLSFYQGKLHATRGRKYRIVHELIWCTLHKLYGGGPIITTRTTMSWTIQMSEGEIAKTLVHTTAHKKTANGSKTGSLQCWFQMECNRHSLLRRATGIRRDGTFNDDIVSAQSAVKAFAAAANQARRDAEGRVSPLSNKLRFSVA
ncbi:hypothetical protein DYB32_003184 [Aphanomyces invadans]|uniref:DUSP domain-containing protein n=1 Tax=Aphanomyces invadans TaxID=157072 RepID=A0A418B1F0_9STRA|nr:hypothetical protein DYB32_003184 [Aphanomyces invadans]